MSYLNAFIDNIKDFLTIPVIILTPIVLFNFTCIAYIASMDYASPYFFSDFKDFLIIFKQDFFLEFNTSDISYNKIIDIKNAIEGEHNNTKHFLTLKNHVANFEQLKHKHNYIHQQNLDITFRELLALQDVFNDKVLANIYKTNSNINYEIYKYYSKVNIYNYKKVFNSIFTYKNRYTSLVYYDYEHFLEFKEHHSSVITKTAEQTILDFGNIFFNYNNGILFNNNVLDTQCVHKVISYKGIDDYTRDLIRQPRKTLLYLYPEKLHIPENIPSYKTHYENNKFVTAVKICQVNYIDLSKI